MACFLNFVDVSSNQFAPLVQVFNMGTYTWRTCPRMLQEMRYPIVSVLDNRIYVLFNTCPGNVGSVHPMIRRKGNRLAHAPIRFQCFDVDQSVWSWKASLPLTVPTTRGAVAITVNHQIYVLGGEARLCLLYDPALDSWRSLPGCLRQHCYGSAFLHRDRIMLCGGQQNEQDTDVIEELSLKDHTWQMSDMKLPHPLSEHHIWTQY